MKKNIITGAALLGLIILSSFKSTQGGKIKFVPAPSPSIAKNATVNVITENNVRYHVLIFGGVVTSTIIESAKGITIVDVGFGMIPNSGKELRNYADALKKPISVIITHDHKDHFQNLDNFRDVPVYATEKNAKLLMADSNFTKAYSGNIITVSGSGNRVIGGFKFSFGEIANTEARENSYLAIESEKALFVGDLTFNKTHIYIRDYTPLDGTDELSGWIAQLKNLENRFGKYKHIFVGHNGHSEQVSANFDANIAYLTDAQGLIKGTKTLKAGGYAHSVKEVVDELALLYPNYGKGGLYLALPNTFYQGDPGAQWFK